MELPQVNDFVHYTRPTDNGPETIGVIVTSVSEDGACDLVIRRNRLDDEPVASAAPYAEEPTDGCWTWPS